MREKIVPVLLTEALILASQLHAPLNAEALTEPAKELNSTNAQILDAFNQDRAALGLQPLVLDDKLSSIAQEIADGMAREKYFGHTSPEGKRVFDRLKENNVPYLKASEIMARNNYSDKETVQVAIDSFLSDQPHKDVVDIPEYSEIGIAEVLTSDGMKIYESILIESSETSPITNPGLDAGKGPYVE
jgi:uncharacterized protein YkwD